MKRREFERLVEAALKRIPREFRRVRTIVAIVVEDWPGPARVEGVSYPHRGESPAPPIPSANKGVPATRARIMKPLKRVIAITRAARPTARTALHWARLRKGAFDMRLLVDSATP